MFSIFKEHFLHTRIEHSIVRAVSLAAFLDKNLSPPTYSQEQEVVLAVVLH